MADQVTLVCWTCDKKDCQQDNHRRLKNGHIVIDDKCDFCGSYIREPITSRIDFSGNILHKNKD
jgi:hypothetical protein